MNTISVCSRFRRTREKCNLVLGTALYVCFVLVGCASQSAQTPISNASTPSTNVSTPAEEKQEEPVLTAEEEEAQKAFAESSSEHDTDIGLRNIKIDTAQAELSEVQKMILAYFDEDYLTVPNYEFLRRYPNVYAGAQLNIGGFVEKVLSASNDEYSLLLHIVKSEEAFFYRSMLTPEDYDAYMAENENSYVVVTGKPSSTWFMEGDYLSVYGRYTGIDTIEIDGTSYTVPFIDASKAYLSFDLGYGPERYDLNYIKTMAEAIFGPNIEVKLPVAGQDYLENMEWRVLDEKPFYLVQLEDQSNAKFTQYRFYTKWGYIEDAKTGEDDWLLGVDPNIQRNIEFSADFEHFFLFTYDKALETLTLEYYSSDLEKVWKREFAETTSAVYDYTKNNIYLVANNELYIINIETGEDTFQPCFIGEKLDIRKLSDGILTVGENKSDAVIKNDLQGNMIWKTNLAGNVYRVEGIQLVGDTILLQLQLEDGLHYVVLDNATGSVIADAVSVS